MTREQLLLFIKAETNYPFLRDIVRTALEALPEASRVGFLYDLYIDMSFSGDVYKVTNIKTGYSYRFAGKEDLKSFLSSYHSNPNLKYLGMLKTRPSINLLGFKIEKETRS